MDAPLPDVAQFPRELCALLDQSVDHSLNGLRSVLGTEFANANRYFAGEFQTRCGGFFLFYFSPIEEFS